MIEAQGLAGLALVVLASAIGIGSAVRLRRGTIESHSGDPVAPSPAYQAPEPTLPILSGVQVLDHTRTTEAVARIRALSGLNEGTWCGHIEPLILQCAELVQLLPASESHHHADPGGLWIHLVETATAAVKLRQGLILPPGCDADDVSRHRHRWTAAVLIAALLHDIGKPVSDVRVKLYGPGINGTPWNAMAGAMTNTQARAYAVHFPAEQERDYARHEQLGALLIQRLVAPRTMAWLGEDAGLIKEILQFLSGDQREGHLAQVIKRAETASVRANLLTGPRTRFATARAVPLIERLMEALRRMLAEGAMLPLNRPGAAGYVYGDDIWFAAARLANATREYLRAHESAAGIPGEDKNDRLFDAWQDYGACRTNAETGLALFGAHVEFDPQIGNPGYDLPAMLRFPLALLYSSPAQYPAQMPGKLHPLGLGHKTGILTRAATTNAGVHTANTSVANAREAAQCSQCEHPEPERAEFDHSVRTANTSQTRLESVSKDTANLVAIAPHSANEGTRSTASANVTEAQTQPDQIKCSPGEHPERPSLNSESVHPVNTPDPDQLAPPQSVHPVNTPIPTPEFLDPIDSASLTDLESPSRKQRKAAQETPKATGAMGAIVPVTPALALPTARTAKSNSASTGAVDFMAWVQRGVADGSLQYNTVGAMVHFVNYGSQVGLLLVSPSIFRHFAQTQVESDMRESDSPGMATQRALSNSGWHIKGPAGKNIWSYQVMRNGNKGGSLLNGFLILDPERFFDPVPPPNDRLILWHTAPSQQKRKEHTHGVSA